MAGWKRKRETVSLSSSSSEEEEYGYVEVEESDGDDDSSDDDGESTSNSSEDTSEEEEGESDSDNEDVDREAEDEFHCNTVIRFLQEGNDLRALNLTECKAYLRKHRLRITGTKAVCIQRIEDDWRMKQKKNCRKIVTTEKRCFQSSETCQRCGEGTMVEERYIMNHVKTLGCKHDGKHKCGTQVKKAAAKGKSALAAKRDNKGKRGMNVVINNSIYFKK